MAEDDLEQRLRGTKIIGFTGGGRLSGDGCGTQYGEQVKALINPDGPAAADRLKRYREALEKIANDSSPNDPNSGYWCQDIARQALQNEVKG